MKKVLEKTQLSSAKWFPMTPKPPVSISNLKNLLFTLLKVITLKTVDFNDMPAALLANCKISIYFCPGSFENRKIFCMIYSNRSIIYIFCCDLKHSE